jgi:Ca2+-binding EF-hand superfamily protein
MASGGFRLPTGDRATARREESDMREESGALHWVALLCSVFALAIAAPAIAEDSKDSKKYDGRGAIPFDQLDTDGDGVLSQEERAVARKKRHEKRLKELDADGDGRVSEAERAAARNKRQGKHLEEFDTDGDGKISEAERAAARNKRQGKHLEGFDTDGDGKISDEERRAAQGKRSNQRARELEQFDADGDGKLTGKEKEQAKAARKKNHERQGRGPRDRPAVDQPGNAPQEP